MAAMMPPVATTTVPTDFPRDRIARRYIKLRSVGLRDRRFGTDAFRRRADDSKRGRHQPDQC